LTDAQYADLIQADLRHYQEAAGPPAPAPVCFGGNPGITSPICTARIAAFSQARQKFQDDLEHSRPPSRLRTMHEQLRQDLASIETFDREFDRIVPTGDQAAFDGVYDSPSRVAAYTKFDDDASQLILCARTQDQAYFERKCR
jgi:hypothetical protein